MTSGAPQPLVPHVPAALHAAAERWPERGIHLYDAAGVKAHLTYPQLLDRARRVAAVLHHRNLRPGARLMVVSPTSLDTIAVLLGAMLAGVAPIPLAPPRQSRTTHFARYLGSVYRLAERLECRHIVADPDAHDLLLARAETEPWFDSALSLGALAAAAAPPQELPDAHDILPDDTAYIQLSSGTTGPPKSVLLSHRSILTNIHAIGEHIQVTPDDVGVSWLPLHNDMGLVGVLFFAIYWGIPLALLNPDRFLRAPHEWLLAFAQHGATLSPAPDFGFHYCTRRAKKSDLEGLDLSSWRVAMSGGESVIPAHVRAFERRFRPYGLRPNVVLPVYGLAEVTLGVSFAPLGAPIRVDRVQRAALETQAAATPALPEEPCLEFVSVGPPLPGLQVQIRGADGAPLPPRSVGEIAVAGHSVMRACVHIDADAPTQPADGWINTGDLGYFADGDLFVTGRAADVIRLGTRDVLPDEIEHLVARIEGVRAGSVAAFGVPRAVAARNRSNRVRKAAEATPPPGATPERDDLLVVAVEVAEGLEAEEMQRIILEVVQKHMDLLPHDVRVLSPRSVPKTSSGKVRRFLCKQLYLEDALDRRERQERWQAITQITDRARNFVAQFGRRIRTFFDPSET